jgi:signal transduction histidine kinase
MTFQTHPARPPARAAPRHEPDIERLRARIAELEREKAATEAFAAEAAHELLTSLVMIDAYATMAAEQLDDEFDADALRNLDALQRGAHEALPGPYFGSHTIRKSLVERSRAMHVALHVAPPRSREAQAPRDQTRGCRLGR